MFYAVFFVAVLTSGSCLARLSFGHAILFDVWLRAYFWLTFGLVLGLLHEAMLGILGDLCVFF